MSTTENDLAEKIVDRLFTAGNGEKATRIELKQKDRICELNLGGWTREAALQQVLEVLREEGK